MSNMRFQKSDKPESGKGKGFYVALGVCLIAIGAAAWTTYDGVKQFVTPIENTSSSPVVSAESQVVSDQEAGNTVSGVTVETSSAPVQSEPEVSSQPANTVSSTASEVTANTQPELTAYPSGKTVIKEFSGSDPVYSLTFNDWRVHEGTDFAADQGSMVRAIAGGTVKDVVNDPMTGVTIIIAHRDYDAYYCGLGETTLVKTGDTVETAQEIGSIKSVPSEIVEPTHLHFAIKKDGKWVDPMEILENKQ